MRCARLKNIVTFSNNVIFKITLLLLHWSNHSGSQRLLGQVCNYYGINWITKSMYFKVRLTTKFEIEINLYQKNQVTVFYSFKNIPNIHSNRNTLPLLWKIKGIYRNTVMIDYIQVQLHFILRKFHLRRSN